MSKASKLKNAIDALEMVDFSSPSESEVALDRVASALLGASKIKESKFWGKAPSLGEVLEKLSMDVDGVVDARSVVDEIEAMIKRAYNEEFNQEKAEEMETLINELSESLLEIHAYVTKKSRAA